LLDALRGFKRRWTSLRTVLSGRAGVVLALQGQAAGELLAAIEAWSTVRDRHTAVALADSARRERLTITDVAVAADGTARLGGESHHVEIVSLMEVLRELEEASRVAANAATDEARGAAEIRLVNGVQSYVAAIRRLDPDV
jgi:hypothetical protein